MTKKPSLRAVALAIAALACAPALAMAQTAGTQAAKPAAPATAPAPPAAGPRTDAGAQQRVEERINQLHTQLRITPAQDPQWKAFADTMRANAKEMDALAEQRAEELRTANAVQDMQSYEHLAEAHVEHLKRLISAFETLYNALSPQQKQAADQVFRVGAEQRAQAGANR